MNIMTVVILAIFILFILSGLKEGAVRKINGILAMLISSLLVSALLPYVTEYIRTKTPVYAAIEQQCQKVISDRVTKTLTGENSRQTDGSSTYGRDQIKSLMDQYGLDSSRVDGFSDDQLREYVEQYLEPYLAPITGQQSLGNLNLSEGETILDGMTRIEQTKLIKNLPVPDFLQRLLINYNNSEGYKRLGVSGFGGYLSGFAADVILNIIAFIVTMILVSLIVHAVLHGLNILAHFPVIHAADHVLGLAIGFVQGLFAVWIIFLVVSMLSGTAAGIAMMDMIDDSVLLKPLYESNLFLKLIVSAISRIM